MLQTIVDMYHRIKEKLELRQYDDFTIENYFRKKGVSIGYRNRIMIKSFGESSWLVDIGNHCTITNGVQFITHDGGTWVFTDEMPDLQKFGTIKICDNCFIGLNSVILPNVIIGPNSIVGACSVVTKNVPNDTVVAGNPARVVCSLSEYRKKVIDIWEKQKPKDYLKELKIGVKYEPEFIDKMKKNEITLLYDHLKKISLL